MFTQKAYPLIHSEVLMALNYIHEELLEGVVLTSAQAEVALALIIEKYENAEDKTDHNDIITNVIDVFPKDIIAAIVATYPPEDDEEDDQDFFNGDFFEDKDEDFLDEEGTPLERDPGSDSE